MPSKEQLATLAEALATASVVGVGWALGGTVGAAVMAGIGINLGSNIIQKGSTHLKEKWISAEYGVLNHDIQRALARAFVKALTSLEARYFELPEANAQPTEKKKAISGLFKELKDEAPSVFAASVEKIISREEVKEYLYGEPESARERIWERLEGTKLLYTYYGEHFKEFLRDNINDELVFLFGEELKTDNHECNKAWRAFQRMLLEGIQADVKALRANQKMIRQDLQVLDGIRTQVNELKGTIDQRVAGEPFQHGLEKALQSMKALLESVAWAARRTEIKVDVVVGVTQRTEEKIDTVVAALNAEPETARRLSPYIGSVLTLSAVRPAGVTKRRESVGDVVQWGRLLDGVYAPRPELLRRVTEEYLSWISNTGAVAQRRRLPVFWIDGRSGDGKSVLLFQLAEFILSARPDTLVYQAARPDSLPALIDHAHNTSLDSRLILIVAEDLHRVTDVETFQAALKLTLDGDQSNVAVLACGPTPEKDAFIRTNQSVEVSAWTMPSISAQDVSIFSSWFDTKIETINTLERTILVELLFAAQIGGSLAGFASTFGNRLRTFGVFETVCNIVAINALDIGGPAELFGSTADRDSIERLAREDQLHFEWKQEGWGLGVRLVHGIIAWRLFEEWSNDPLRGPSIEVRLARVLSSILHIPQLPNVFGVHLMRSLGRRLDTLLECAPLDLARNKQQIFDEVLTNTDDSPSARCFPLMAILAEYSSNDQSFVNPAHITLAERIVADDNSPARSRTLIAAYLSILEFSERIVSKAYRVQAEGMVFDSVVGAHAAVALWMLVDRAGSAPILLERWLDAHTDVAPPKHFLCSALNLIGTTPAVMRATLDWIRENWNGYRAIELLTILIRINKDKETIDLAMKWVAENFEEARASDVLAALTHRNKNDERVRELAAHWIRNHPKRPAALDVMSTLLRVPSKKLRSELRELTITLVREHLDRPLVTNLLTNALGTFTHDDEIYGLAVEWLERHQSQSQAADVIKSLLWRSPDDDQITELALDWVALMSAYSFSAHVLSTLLSSRNHSKSLQAAALDWIRKHPENTQVFNPISTLLRVAGDEVSVRDAAYEWVSTHLDSAGASHVLSSLIKADPGDVKVRELATSWASSNRLNKITGQLVSTLLRVTGGEPTIRQLALDWLSVHERRIEAAQLLGTLLFATDGEPEIQRLATIWVNENTHRRNEQHQVLAALIGTSSVKDEWINLSLSLLGSPRAEGEIPSLFEALAIAAPLSPAVEAVLMQFIENPRNGVRPRQNVLEAWISAGGPTGPAIGALSVLRTRDRLSDDGRQLFGIMTRACARTWETLIQAVVKDPSQGRTLCYLVGLGIPSVQLDVEVFMLSIKKWPAEELCYVWKGLIESSAAAEVLIDPLCEWLRPNWRLKGYGVVLRAIAKRTITEVAFALRLPREVYADLKAMDRPAT